MRDAMSMGHAGRFAFKCMNARGMLATRGPRCSLRPLTNRFGHLLQLHLDSSHCCSFPGDCPTRPDFAEDACFVGALTSDVVSYRL
jgi:hypothetical protein